MRLGHLIAVVLVLVVPSERPALAQVQEKFEIPPGVVDVRLSFARFGQSPELAGVYTLVAQELPGHGWGIEMGGHLYPFKYRGLTIGVGGAIVTAGGRRNPGVPVSGRSQAPNVHTRFSTGFARRDAFTAFFNPQLSFNFAGSNGFSYVSGGLGTARLTIGIDGVEPDRPSASPKTINYGGGARWFITPHVAFTFDVRVYAISPVVVEGFGLVNPRMNLVFVSAGMSMK